MKRSKSLESFVPPPSPLQEITARVRSDVGNLREMLKTAADEAHENHAWRLAGSLLVFERQVGRAFLSVSVDGFDAEAPGRVVDEIEDETEPGRVRKPRPPRAPAGAGSPHRHRFNEIGACSICGKPKAAGGRPPKEPTATVEGVTKVDPVSEPLPMVNSRPELAGDEVADRFAGGGLGSSGVVRR